MSKPEGSHTCVMCNAKLESKEALQDHFRKHANKEIDLKGRQLGPTGELKELTNKDRTYIKGTGSQINTNILCDVCGEAFTCNTKAIQHKFRKHPFNAAKHFCPQCGMQFPLLGHRDKHLKEQHETEHVPKNPYPCYQCGAVFYNKMAHEYHHKSAHHRVVSLYKQIITPPPSKKIRYNNAGEPQSAYYCHLCGIEYISKFNLEKHLERQHTAQERGTTPVDLFKCNTCDGLFYNEKAYTNHNTYHRPGDLYVTSEEQRLQTVRRVDQDFDIRRVQPVAERYMPKYRRRRTNIFAQKNVLAKKPSSDDDEMSPPPNSDSDDEVPVSKSSTTNNTTTTTSTTTSTENNTSNVDITPSNAESTPLPKETASTMVTTVPEVETSVPKKIETSEVETSVSKNDTPFTMETLAPTMVTTVPKMETSVAEIETSVPKMDTSFTMETIAPTMETIAPTMETSVPKMGSTAPTAETESSATTSSSSSTLSTKLDDPSSGNVDETLTTIDLMSPTCSATCINLDPLAIPSEESTTSELLNL